VNQGQCFGIDVRRCHEASPDALLARGAPLDAEGHARQGELGRPDDPDGVDQGMPEEGIDAPPPDGLSR
jgi:hypothetical protein